MPKQNNQLTGDEIPKLAGFNYQPNDRVWVIDLLKPRRQPVEMTYKGWLLLTVNYIILGPVDPANVKIGYIPNTTKNNFVIIS